MPHITLTDWHGKLDRLWALPGMWILLVLPGDEFFCDVVNMDMETRGSLGYAPWRSKYYIGEQRELGRRPLKTNNCIILENSGSLEYALWRFFKIYQWLYMYTPEAVVHNTWCNLRECLGFICNGMFQPYRLLSTMCYIKLRFLR